METPPASAPLHGKSSGWDVARGGLVGWARSIAQRFQGTAEPVSSPSETGGWTGALAVLRQKSAMHGCRACGECCRYFGGNLRASSRDLDRWREAGRDDLLRLVNRLGWIWVDPETGRFHDPCPFLLGERGNPARCAVHEIKPDMCRAYPTLAHEKRCVRGVSFL